MDVNKQKIMNNFDAIAKVYDDSKESRFATQCYSYVLNTLLPIQFSNILDIGCGTGTLMAKLLEERPLVRVYGLDLSESMVEIAQTKLNKRTEVAYGEAEALPYDNKKFDVIVMVDSFGYFIDPLQAIQEAYRVLKPRGKLIIADKMVTGFKKVFFDSGRYSEEEIRGYLAKAGFDIINLVRNIPNGYIATADKR